MKYTWEQSTAFKGLVNLLDENGTIIAWIHKRPDYCDRGHYQMNVDIPCGLDDQDRFPRYYMRLETAKQETEDFIKWRLEKIRAGG